MAIVWRAVPTVSYTFVDDDGNAARLTAGLQGDITAGPLVATMQRGAAEFGKAIGLVSDAALIGGSLTYTWYDDSYPAGAAGSEVERKGAMVLRDEKGYLASVEVPSIDQDVLLADKITIDPADENVADLIEWLTEEMDMTPFSLEGDVKVCNTKGESLLSFLEGYQVHRASRKQRSRRG